MFAVWPLGAIALAEVLAESRHLTHIDLKDNDIKVAGVMALQLGHRMNQTLISLELPKSSKVEQVGMLCVYHLLDLGISVISWVVNSHLI